jgi:hypothetical protein
VAFPLPVTPPARGGALKDFTMDVPGLIGNYFKRIEKYRLCRNGNPYRIFIVKT